MDDNLPVDTRLDLLVIFHILIACRLHRLAMGPFGCTARRCCLFLELRKGQRESCLLGGREYFIHLSRLTLHARDADHEAILSGRVVGLRDKNADISVEGFALGSDNDAPPAKSASTADGNLFDGLADKGPLLAG